MVSIYPKLNEQFLPKHCVTGLFARHSAIERVLPTLHEAGFNDAEIQVFDGPEGASSLDVNAEKKSTADFILRAFTKALADDAGYLEHADAVLRDGGVMVCVSTGKSEEQATIASAAMRFHGGQDVQHWDDWTTEQL